MTKLFDPPLPAKASKSWNVMYPDPITVQTGDHVKLGNTDPEWPGWQWCTDARGKSGWVPISYINHRYSETGIMKFAFTARELEIAPGDKLQLYKLESAWYWARNQSGSEGWVPGTHVIIHTD
jgi:uncharacterized protein YgiM (DUF1202 family)